MTVTRCISSQLMTHLLTWRNPQGSEEQWFTGVHPPEIENGLTHVGKVLSTEIGLCLLVTAAAVETVAYASLAILSLALYPVTDEPHLFFYKLLDSSSFTILWGVADALIYNLFFINVLTNESMARYWVNMFNPTPVVFRIANQFYALQLEVFRAEDRLYVHDWMLQHTQQAHPHAMLAPILNEGQAVQNAITQGAAFLKEDVLANAPSETLELFRECDLSIYMFILSKAVYMYAAGSKNTEETIPDFFKPSTRALITAWRSEHKSAEILKALEQLIADPTQFETVPQDADVQAAFNQLRNIASEELQGGLLATRCWSAAIQELPAAAS